mmetsp:Transcript_320/g.584  ORF Transcript_320/g.584 Transcript_320/m.584 type:complete len:456 (+) Transcript_320:41-1408(+)
MTQQITSNDVTIFRNQFASDAAATVAQNAVTNNAVNAVALNRSIIQTTDTKNFSHKVDKSWSVTNQKSSGRCWLFATLNLFRIGAMKKLNVKEFEFSQAYVHFWDKFERCNHFLEAMIETASRDVDDRTVAYMLHDPIGDGGQWCMAINIIRKHGLVPKSVFPESRSSSETRLMNTNLKEILRCSACEIRNILSSTSGDQGLRLAIDHKRKRLGDVWRMLCIHLGTPPETFSWQWTDVNGSFHRVRDVSPVEFCLEYACVNRDINEYVCLVNDPRNPFMQTYTVDYLQSVVGGDPVVYLNVDAETMKRITQQQLEAGEAVWMGCDVGKQLHRESGVWDKEMFQYQELYGVSYGMNKAQRLLHGQTLMTHAMMFTGVDVVEGRPLRWRVENSWGENSGEKGFYTMNDNWFEEHMFEIAAPRSYLSEEMLQCLDTLKPIRLPAWDPMGSLARSEAYL